MIRTGEISVARKMKKNVKDNEKNNEKNNEKKDVRRQSKSSQVRLSPSISQIASSESELASESSHSNACEVANHHFRRCHLCGCVSESSSGRVQACSACGKVMAPFFFFDEHSTLTLSTSELRPSVQFAQHSTDSSQAQHPPVRGLTAFW